MTTIKSENRISAKSFTVAGWVKAIFDDSIKVERFPKVKRFPSEWNSIYWCEGGWKKLSRCVISWHCISFDSSERSHRFTCVTHLIDWQTPSDFHDSRHTLSEDEMLFKSYELRQSYCALASVLFSLPVSNNQFNKTTYSFSYLTFSSGLWSVDLNLMATYV